MTRTGGNNNGERGGREERGLTVSDRVVGDQGDDARPGVLRMAREERGGRTAVVPKLSGNRDEAAVEKLLPERAIPKLRDFVDVLRDNGSLTAEQCTYFEAALDLLEVSLPAEINLKEGPGKEARQKLEDANPYRVLPPHPAKAAALETKVTKAYKNQLLSTVAVLEGFDRANTTNTQKLALLAYANYMVNRLEGQDNTLTTLNQQLTDIGIDTNVLIPVERAFGRVGTEVQVTFDSFLSPMLAGDSEVMTGDRINESKVEPFLDGRAKKTFEDLRGFVKAVDALATDEERADMAKHPDSERIGVGRDGPFRDWEEKVKGKHGDKVVCIDGMLGENRRANGVFGSGTDAGINQHDIKTYKSYAAVEQVDGRETRKTVVCAAFTFFGTVYGGEHRRGRELQPGEVVRDKKFFDDLVKLTTHSWTIDSADKAADAMLQLMAAKNAVVDEFSNVKDLGKKFYADMTIEERQTGVFMIPILDVRGNPTFLAVRGTDMAKMYECVKRSQESFAKCAETDKRFAAKAWEDRAKGFDLPQKSIEPTYANWVEDLRDATKVEAIADEEVRKLRAGRASETTTWQATQIEEARANYLENFALFEANYCKLENYRQEAERRLLSRAFVNNGGAGWQERLNNEVKVVALEYMYKAQAYKNLTAKLEGMRDGKQLRALLLNVDYEVEIATMVMIGGATEKELRETAKPFLRTKEGYKNAAESIQSGFDAAKFDYAFVRGSMETFGVTSDQYAQLYGLRYDGFPLMTRLHQLAEAEVPVIADPADPGAFRLDAEGLNQVKTAEKLLALMNSFGPLPRRAPARGAVCAENINRVIATDSDEGLHEELVDMESVGPANEAFGNVQARFHTLFKRFPTEQERIRYMQENNDVVRARKEQISRLNMATGVHRAIVTEVAELYNTGIDVTVMDDRELLEFVGRLYPVLKGLSDAGLEPGLDDMIKLRITDTRDPKRRPVIRAAEIENAVGDSMRQARRDVQAREVVSAII